MGFDNHYPRRKDHRKPYHARGKHDRTCRPNGTCPYCQNNRRHSNFKKKLIAEDKLKEFKDDPGR
jgi:hypothetical protein